MTERQPGIQQMHSPRPPSPTVNPPDESVPHSRLNASGKGLRPSTLKLPLLSPTHRIPTPLKSPGFDRELSFNERDHVYNPDPDQMANTLLTVAMVRLGKPLPAEYNSFLLHVLEEYRKMRRQLDAIRVDLQAEVEGRQSDLHVMQVEREAYKAEVKRLERLILDGTNGGPDALALARKGSLLRNGCDNEDSDEKEQTTVSGDSSVKRHQGRTYHRVLSEQDVRISRLFASNELAECLPPGTAPLQECVRVFDGSSGSSPKPIEPLTPMPTVESRLSSPSSSQTHRPTLGEQRLFFVHHDDSSESSDGGTGAESSQMLQEHDRGTQPDGGFAEGTIQSDVPLPAGAERTSTHHKSDHPAPEPLRGFRARARDCLDSVTSTILNSQSSRPAASQALERLANETSLTHREQSEPLTKKRDSHKRGYSFSPGDDTVPILSPKAYTRSKSAQAGPNNGEGNLFRAAMPMGIDQEMAPSRCATGPADEAVITGAFHSGTPSGQSIRMSRNEKPDRGRTRKVSSSSSIVTVTTFSGSKKETGGGQAERDERTQADFSYIAAARALSGASSKKPGRP